MTEPRRSETEGFADLEGLLANALRPIDPPESLGSRVETTLTKVTEAAAGELTGWADDLTETEVQALRDPRNWVRPLAAAAVGGAAGTALVLIEVRRRRRGEGLRGVGRELRARF